MILRIHPRMRIADKARREHTLFLADLIEEHGLTFGEVTRILAQALDDSGRYLVREERHPYDPDKKGDEA